MLSSTVTMPPSDEEQISELYRLLQHGTPALVGPDDERIELPESVYHILKDVVRNMKAGKSIALISRDQELTTQSAAIFLGFSRPHLIKLLEEGRIPFRKVGLHRRICFRHLMEFQKKRDIERRNALSDLARTEYKEGEYEGSVIPEGGSDE